MFILEKTEIQMQTMMALLNRADEPIVDPVSQAAPADHSGAPKPSCFGVHSMDCYGVALPVGNEVASLTWGSSMACFEFPVFLRGSFSFL